jgi:hypothetical protein
MAKSKNFSEFSRLVKNFTPCVLFEHMSDNNTPPNGGIKIQPKVQSTIRSQAEAFAITRPWHAEYQLQLRFKNQFCYLDAAKKDEDAFPLGRLRYFGPEKWSLAFFAYSSDRYEPCMFSSGKWFGTLEEAIAICELYLV